MHTKVELFIIDKLKEFFRKKHYKYSVDESGGIVVYNPKQAREIVYKLKSGVKGVDYDIMKKMLEELESSPWN